MDNSFNVVVAVKDGKVFNLHVAPSMNKALEHAEMLSKTMLEEGISQILVIKQYEDGSNEIFAEYLPEDLKQDNLQIKVKITIIGDDFELSFIEDVTEYAHVLVECGNVFSDTGVRMTHENIRRYFASGEFTDEEIADLNGSHYIFGFLEAFGQSDRCPSFLYNYNGKLRYKVEQL